MRKQLLTALSALLMMSSISSQGLFQSAQLIEDFSLNQVDSFLTAQGVPTGMIGLQHGIKAYKITYSTVSWDSSATIATGVVFLPQNTGTCKKPILNYNHGTIIKKVDAPSNKVGEYVIGIAFSGAGYIVVMPDYLGLGDSPGLHPYIHAQSEATCVVDMIRASKEYMDSVNYLYNDQLFLTGYSQGGHATMAAHRLLQEEYASTLPVTASYPLSGPYDVSGVQAEVITKDSSYGAPGYLPFVLFSYNMVYGMYSSWDAVLKAPYNATVPPLMDGSVSLGVVEGFIPDTPNSIILPLLLDTFENDMSHRFREALYDNDLYRWTPQCPVRLGYCTSDELVSYKNAIVAQDSMTARGAPDVQAVFVNSTSAHGDCALFALLMVNEFFNPLRDDLIDLNLVTTDVSSPTSTDGAIVSNINGGVPVYNYAWSNTNTTPNLSGLGVGSYTLTITDNNGCSATASANIGVVGIQENLIDIGLNIYPNPSQGEFFIEFNQPLFQAELTILNVVGKVIYTGIIPNQQTQFPINMSQLSKGIYLVKVDVGSQAFTKRIIIQ